LVPMVRATSSAAMPVASAICAIDVKPLLRQQSQCHIDRLLTSPVTHARKRSTFTTSPIGVPVWTRTVCYRPPHSAGPLKIVAHGGQYGGGVHGVGGADCCNGNSFGGLPGPGSPPTAFPSGPKYQSWQTLRPPGSAASCCISSGRRGG
jgi:hypothetical protein